MLLFVLLYISLLRHHSTIYVYDDLIDTTIPLLQLLSSPIDDIMIFVGFVIAAPAVILHSLGAEILVKAIEDQAIADIANVLDGPTISARILAGSWPTLKSDTALTFSANRQAIGEFVSLQYNTAGNAAVITSSAELLYPMPSFVGREVTDEDTTGDVINNYNGDDGCDADSAMALTLTAVFCLVGGIFIGAGLFWAAMSKAQGDKSTGLAAKEGTSSSSAL